MEVIKQCRTSILFYKDTMWLEINQHKNLIVLTRNFDKEETYQSEFLYSKKRGEETVIMDHIGFYWNYGLLFLKDYCKRSTDIIKK